MKKSAFPNRFLGVLCIMVLAALLVAGPAGALSPVALRNQAEPTPRETATGQPTPTATPTPTNTSTPAPIPYITLDPTRAVGQQKVRIKVTGYHWTTAGPGLTLYWDEQVTPNLLDGPFRPDPQGWFERVVEVRAAWAVVGNHRVIAADNLGATDQVAVELIAPTPAPPTATASPTLTPTPSPTLRPLTPMVTITPFPPTKAPVYPTRAPTLTRTSTPIPGTATYTPTPSRTPTATQTPGPGTPSVTPAPTSTPTMTPLAAYDEEISDTGAGWGMIFLWGGVLAGLLVVFRMLRVRGLNEPR